MYRCHKPCPTCQQDVPCQRKHRGRMYRCHMPSPTCSVYVPCQRKQRGEDVPLPQAQPHLSVDFPCQRKHRGRGCTAATSPAPPVSRCSMTKKTQREDVPLPQALPHLSADVPCQRKHRGRMYRCHKPRPICQQMFHVKENTEGGCTAATSPVPPVSRCSMSKKTQRGDVPLPQAQPHLSADVP